MTDHEIENQLRDFIAEESAVEDRGLLERDSDLLKAGILDSTIIVATVAFCEENFGIALDLAELSEDQFRSLGAIVGLVRSRLG